MMSPSMMQTSVPLAPHTTLGVGGGARLFVEVKNANDLQNAVAYGKAHKEPWVVLGGGSNILVPDAGYDCLVIKMAIEGITI
jgi:UDP-N-acetylmuramate dehydrogenase